MASTEVQQSHSRFNAAVVQYSALKPWHEKMGAFPSSLVFRVNVIYDKLDNVRHLVLHS